MNGAAGIAAEFLVSDLASSLALASAKARASEAAGIVSSIAHQAHGAIGFTDEYRLGRLTKAMWRARAEFGGAGYWQEEIGGMVLDGAVDDLWLKVIRA